MAGDRGGGGLLAGVLGVQASLARASRPASQGAAAARLSRRVTTAGLFMSVHHGLSPPCLRFLPLSWMTSTPYHVLLLSYLRSVACPPIRPLSVSLTADLLCQAAQEKLTRQQAVVL